MFVRWRKGAYTSSAYLVKAVRVDGQPRQKVIAQLCTCRTGRLSEEQPDLWGRAEYTLRTLHLDGRTREMVYQALAKKTPQLSPGRIEQALQAYEATLQERAERLVPDVPPEITEPDTTDKETFPFFIKWKVEQGRPKFGVPAKYTAFLAKYVMIKGKQRAQVVTRLNPEAMSAEDLQGHTPYRWKQFWYQVHSELVLAQIDEHSYHAIMKRLEIWVKRPAQEELFEIGYSQKCVESCEFFTRFELTSWVISTHFYD
jgi:hypothetical protein